jgi:hypothetical protein
MKNILISRLTWQYSFQVKDYQDELFKTGYISEYQLQDQEIIKLSILYLRKLLQP